ncbi:DUF4350 domain-containing protein [Pseudonocardia sp. TRM90224]|uniref:DUF4350 domain-containing protein n=1 Tax=Pseudonocardia sp. TRM90224 TaxID=2812678 RepID=UPI001E4ED947|nr:DUF4350 domain-containing protein [Pseudonocardia sp. TRM90224]
MTTPTSTTSVHRDPARIWKAARTPLVIAALVLAAATLIALLTDRTTRGALDPEGVSPAGSRAVATILRNEGVTVTVVRTSADVRLAGRGTTVLVPFPELLSQVQLDALRGSADVVLVAPDERVLDAVTPDVELTQSAGPVDVSQPDCTLAAATRAGAVQIGGRRYRSLTAIGCYPAEGGNALMQAVVDGRTVTVIGSADILTNDALDEEGNASLALSLLGGNEELRWFLPSPEGPPAGDERSFSELIPAGWVFAAVQLMVAALVVVLWRARRLGPVVEEPLPVVVRSAEAVEGRARLYRAAGARDHAAEVLREAARARLIPMLGLPDTTATGPSPALIEAVAGRVHRPAVQVEWLLYGPAPADDAGLIELANLLDMCESEVRQS